MRTLRALLIEDNVDDADLLLRELRKAEYEVEYIRAASADEVRDALFEEWDIVLSDYGLGSFTGLDALEIIQESGRDIPFILISGSIGDDAAASLMRHGASDYILKDRLSRLVPAIQRVLYDAESRREKREAENALAQSEERLKLALGAAGLGAWERDLLTHEVFWSPETSALLGVTVGGAHIEGLHWQILEEDRPRIQKKYDEAISTRLPITVRFRIRRRGGEIIWVSESAQCEYDEFGSPLRLVGTIRDITRDKLAEDALIEAEERYRVMAESASDAVISIDENSTVHYANPATEAVFGYRPDELVGKSITTLIPDRFASGHLAGLQRFIDTGQKTLDWRHTETTARTKDGSEIAVQISFGHHKKGDRHFFTAFIRDISVAKAAENAIRESERNLEALVQATTRFVWQLDEKANLIEYPHWWEELTGQDYESSRLYGWVECLHPDDRERVKAAYIEALDKKERAALELRIRSVGGEYRHYWGAGVPLPTEKGTRWICALSDITAQRTAEERYRLVSNVATDYVFSATVDDNGNLYQDWVAGAFEQITGYDTASFRKIGGWPKIVHPEDISIDRQDLDRLRRNEPVESELRIVRSSGEVVWIRVYAKPIWDGGASRLTGIYGAVKDITERKLAELAVLESETRYRHLFENNPYPMWVYDLETFKFLAVNEAAVSVYGYSVEEFLSMTIFDIRPQEDAEPLLERLRSKLNKLEAPRNWRHMRKDGSIIKVEITSHALDWEGKAARLVLAHDVSDRLRAEDALRRSEFIYRELFENANDVIYTHDLNGNFTSLNFAGERVTGYTEAEALTMNLDQVVVPEFLDRARRMMRRKVEGSPPTIYETEIVAKDGRRVPLEINTRLIFEDGKPIGVQGIGRDISERLAAQEALKNSEEQLRQSQKLESIGILAGGMAHDFNNMLTAINGYSDLILRKIAADDPIRKNVEEIKKAGERSAQLTSQLLAFSRRQILQPKVLNLNDIIEETLSLLRRLIGEDITIERKLDRDLWQTVADAGQLSQVLMNLAINARDAMADGGSLIIETSNVDLDEEYASKHIGVAPGRFVMLAVSDTGAGMDEDTRKRVFEPFFTTKAVGRGTGLGLSTVYGIVKQSGGNIWVYSEPNQGTTFKIYLPEAKGEQPHLHLEGSQREIHLGSETILLVEDEGSVRGLAREILEACGYEVLEAVDGVDALEKFQAMDGPLDLLITDVIMPNMGGRELSEKLLARSPRTRVLFTSGYTDDAILRHGITDEGTNFLQKPFTFASLSKKVRSLLDI